MSQVSHSEFSTLFYPSLPLHIATCRQRCHLPQTFTAIAETAERQGAESVADYFSRLGKDLAAVPLEKEDPSELRDRLYNGYEVFKTGDYVRASEVFYALVLKGYPPVFFLAALTAGLRGDYLESFALARIGTLYPNSKPVWQFFLNLAEKFDLSEETMISLFESAKKEAVDSRAFFWSAEGDYYLRHGDPGKADKAYYRALLAASDSKEKAEAIFKMCMLKTKSQQRFSRFNGLAANHLAGMQNSAHLFYLDAEFAELSRYNSRAKNSFLSLITFLPKEDKWMGEAAFMHHTLRTGTVEETKMKCRYLVRSFPNQGVFHQMKLQLCYEGKFNEQHMQEFFRDAFRDASNSPEVHCEHARYLISIKFDYGAARQSVQNAIELNPKYGDSYLEWARLEMIENGSLADLSHVVDAASKAIPSQGFFWKFFTTVNATLPSEVISDYVTHILRYPFLSSSKVSRFSCYYKSKTPVSMVSTHINQVPEQEEKQYRARLFRSSLVK